MVDNSSSSDQPDEIFLEGPRSRFEELITLLRVVWDFLRKAIEPFGLKLRKRIRRQFPWLGERGLAGNLQRI